MTNQNQEYAVLLAKLAILSVIEVVVIYLLWLPGGPIISTF